MHCIIDLLTCWHFHHTFFFKTNINSIKIKATLSKNVLRKPCLCHILRSWVKNASSSSRVDPVVFHATHVPVQLFKLCTYKILRSHHTEDEATCDTGSYLNQNFRVSPISFQGTRTFPSNFTHPNLGTRFFLRGVGCNTPGV